MKWSKRIKFKQLPVRGRNYDLLDMLLQPTMLRNVYTRKGFRKLLVIRTATENIERYRHLWEE